MTESNTTEKRYAEFIDLLPLTIALAGLPASESGKYYTMDQIEARSFTIKHAYRQARSLANDQD